MTNWKVGQNLCWDSSVFVPQHPKGWLIVVIEVLSPLIVTSPVPSCITVRPGLFVTSRGPQVILVGVWGVLHSLLKSFPTQNSRIQSRYFSCPGWKKLLYPFLLFPSKAQKSCTPSKPPSARSLFFSIKIRSDISHTSPLHLSSWALKEHCCVMSFRKSFVKRMLSASAPKTFLHEP